MKKNQVMFCPLQLSKYFTMSSTSLTKSSEVSESDSRTSYATRRHPYNTRSSRKISNDPQRRTAKKINKADKFQQKNNSVPNDPCSEVNNFSMDYCFETCQTPPLQEKKTSRWGFFFTGIIGFFIFGLFLVVLYSHYFMYQEVTKLKEEVQKLKGGHKKEDPHAKLYQELDRKCSDTLKLLLRDSVGRPDFALQSSGGRVVSVDSSTYSNPKTFLGFNLCEGEHGPSSMIQATTAPGECWAFKGHSAKAVIQLIDDILIDSVSLEHIPATISPSGSIDTAPKDFKIWGLNTPVGNKRLLGQFKYESNGGTVQTFGISDDSSYYKYVEFEVLSNHGNRDFTCVYRIRIHGTTKKLT